MHHWELSGCITAWYGSCSAADRKALQRVVKTAERIIGGHLPSVQGIYNSRCLRKARNNVKDHSHPGYGLFTLLPSGRCYRSIRARTTRLTNSFYPQAVRLLNHWTVAITLYFTPIQIHLLHIYINPHFFILFNLIFPTLETALVYFKLLLLVICYMLFLVYVILVYVICVTCCMPSTA